MNTWHRRSFACRDNDVLDLSRIEAGKLELAQGNFNLRGPAGPGTQPDHEGPQAKNLQLLIEYDRFADLGVWR